LGRRLLLGLLGLGLLGRRLPRRRRPLHDERHLLRPLAGPAAGTLRDDREAAALLVGVLHVALRRDIEVERAAFAVAELHPRVAAALVELRARDADRDLDLGRLVAGKFRLVGLHADAFDLRNGERGRGAAEGENNEYFSNHGLPPFSKSVMLSTCAVCGNMLTTPAATSR